MRLLRYETGCPSLPRSCVQSKATRAKTCLGGRPLSKLGKGPHCIAGEGGAGEILVPPGTFPPLAEPMNGKERQPDYLLRAAKKNNCPSSARSQKKKKRTPADDPQRKERSRNLIFQDQLLWRSGKRGGGRFPKGKAPGDQTTRQLGDTKTAQE